jgi:hypothetical protein
MVITSKFRTLFLLRKGLSFLIIDAICIVLISSFFQDGSYLETFFFGCILIFILVYQYMSFNSIKSLIINDKGITTISFLSESKKFFPFSDIQSIKTDWKDGMYSDVGQITEGYHETIITLKNGKTLLLTPDYYKNYDRMIVSIRANVE